MSAWFLDSALSTCHVVTLSYEKSVKEEFSWLRYMSLQ